MNVLDENIAFSQVQLLQRWRIQTRQIGYEVGRRGMQDEEILTLLRQFRRVTFFSQDRDFFHRHSCHANQCLVYLTVPRTETAAFIRRVLRAPALNTWAGRMGKVVRVTTKRLQMWDLHARQQIELPWRAS